MGAEAWVKIAAPGDPPPTPVSPKMGLAPPRDPRPMPTSVLGVDSYGRSELVAAVPVPFLVP